MWPDGFNVHQTPLHESSSVESCFEPKTIQPRGRDLTNRPLRHLKRTGMCVSRVNSKRFGLGNDFIFNKGRGSLVVRSRLWGRRAPGSKPDSTEDPPCIEPVARYIIRSCQTPSRWCGVEVWRGRGQLRCRPRHLTAVQNDEVCPKTAPVLL
ncbi:hypothetical protein AVEN_260452-1 [Araneus ventricosus]|uniref:Uncharacterized protein n=1 Tax=Araneus ventricosus TaxID=182803 RepID=A0A4Y2INH1_ARAVE|nr:hypothetical protein AVEN_260452-1 [Araneus ventricosus]